MDIMNQNTIWTKVVDRPLLPFNHAADVSEQTQNKTTAKPGRVTNGSVVIYCFFLLAILRSNDLNRLQIQTKCSWRWGDERQSSVSTCEYNLWTCHDITLSDYSSFHWGMKHTHQKLVCGTFPKHICSTFPKKLRRNNNKLLDDRWATYFLCSVQSIHTLFIAALHLSALSTVPVQSSEAKTLTVSKNYFQGILSHLQCLPQCIKKHTAML